MKKTINKPRDPFFNEMIKRKSGAHIKSKKTERSKQKQQLKKEWK